MLALCWGLALGMGALVGRELHAEAERNFALGEGPRWQVAATAALDRIGAVTGLARLREALEERKRLFYGTAFTVGGRQSPPPAPDPGPADASNDAESVAPAPAEASADAESIAPAPRRILLVGASSIQTDLGRALERRIEDDLGVEVLRHGRHSTGMARPDYFDWNARALELNADFRPDLVIAQFGGNDGQGLTDRDTGRAVAPFFTDAWDAEYGARLEAFVGLFADAGVPVVILGMPAMRNDYHQSKMARINAVTRAACERAGAHFVDTFAMTADADGNALARAEVDGRTRIVHAGDGMHLSLYGSDMVAAGIVDVLADWFTFAPSAAAVAGGVAAAEVSAAAGVSVAETAPPGTSRPAAAGRAAAVAAPPEASWPATIERPAGPRARPGGGGRGGAGAGPGGAVAHPARTAGAGLRPRPPRRRHRPPHPGRHPPLAGGAGPAPHRVCRRGRRRGAVVPRRVNPTGPGRTVARRASPTAPPCNALH